MELSPRVIVELPDFLDDRQIEQYADKLFLDYSLLDGNIRYPYQIKILPKPTGRKLDGKGLRDVPLSSLQKMRDAVSRIKKLSKYLLEQM